MHTERMAWLHVLQQLEWIGKEKWQLSLSCILNKYLDDETRHNEEKGITLTAHPERGSQNEEKRSKKYDDRIKEYNS